MKETLQKTVQRTAAVILAVALVFGLTRTGSFITFAYDAKGGMVYLSSTNGLLQTYESPSTDAAGMNKLVYGKPVTVVDETTDSDGVKWYKITYYIHDGATMKTAYCRAADILLDEDAVITATGKTNANNVTLWSCTGNYKKPAVTTLSSGTKLDILDTITSAGATWHRVRCTLNGTVYIGWLESQYVTEDAVPDIETDEEYEKYLLSIGFPESYVKSLAVLHEQYPNWTFEPVLTGLDWNTVITEESKPGRNLIYKTEDDAKKSLADSEYDWYTNQWTIRDSTGWVTAHPDFIAYCMDPRNFLNAVNIFMFESLSFNNNHNLEGVQAVIKGTFMEEDADNGDGTMLNYANAFLEIGQLVGVSPYHLATRVRQEQGSGTSPLISGTYTGYEGYYNYFNINAYGTPNSVLYANGLSYARKKGWDTRYKSLLGGSTFIAEKYIGVGQDTLYTQKFDVIAEGGLYTHQYMTSVQAAISESKTVAKVYTDKTQTFAFKIPVYTNMPSEAVQFTGSGNPNNYLSELNISGLSLTPTFDSAKTEYSLIVENDVSSITVSASPVASASKVSGTGTHELKVGTNTIKINCTSQSGVSKTYNLTVVRQETPEEPEEPTYTLTTDKYLLETYVTGVEPGTTVEEFIKGFTCEGAVMKVLTASGTENTGIVATGNKMVVYVNDTLVATKEIVIYGDVTGDGKVTALDAIKLNRYTIGTSTLSGCYLAAADANRDAKANVLDAIIINRYTIGLSTINQK